MGMGKFASSTKMGNLVKIISKVWSYSIDVLFPELACQPSLNEKLPEIHSASEQLIGWQHTNENGLVVLERKRMGKMLELSRKLMIHNGLQVIHKQA